MSTASTNLAQFQVPKVEYYTSFHFTRGHCPTFTSRVFGNISNPHCMIWFLFPITLGITPGYFMSIDEYLSLDTPMHLDLWAIMASAYKAALH
jgi:hypothetical protein